MLTEKQDEIAWQTFCKADGPQEKRVYAAVEAVLAAQPAAQPFSVTLEEAREIAERYYASNTLRVRDMQFAINAVLARRPAAQEAPTPSAQESERLTCPRCGKDNTMCAGADGACCEAPSPQESELVETMLDAQFAEDWPHWREILQTHDEYKRMYENMAAALAAVRPQIDAERDKAWETQISMNYHLTDGHGSTWFLKQIRARLTPMQEPKERVRVQAAAGRSDVYLDDEWQCIFIAEDAEKRTREAERYVAGLHAEIGEK